MPKLVTTGKNEHSKKADTLLKHFPNSSVVIHSVCCLYSYVQTVHILEQSF